MPTGQAVATTGGKLPARHVIHVVGPVHGSGGPELLASCYREALRVADELRARTVAFPAVSTGVYGWPLDDAARIAVGTVLDTPCQVRQVSFVLFSADAYAAFEQALAVRQQLRRLSGRSGSAAPSPDATGSVNPMINL